MSAREKSPLAPDVPVPHTGEFLGGATHVLKVAESLAEKGCDVFIVSRRMRGQRKCEKYSGADDIEDEAHLYERGERHTKDRGFYFTINTLWWW